MNARSDDPELADLLRGVDFRGTLQDWTRCRRALTECVATGDRVLDLGCGGGFLLASLTIWLDAPLVPFGLDNNPSRIAAARRLFPEFAQNFAVADLLAPEWPIDAVDVVIGPFVANVSYVRHCCAVARRVAVLSLYDDASPTSWAMAPEFCRSAGLRVEKVIITANVTKLVVVSLQESRPEH